ncbi:MAG TPA: DUF4876 domain-containing protein [Niastella sp.]
MNSRLYLIMLLLIIFYACQKKDLGSSASPVNLSVAMEYNREVSSIGLRKDSALIRITNNTSGTTKEAYTNNNGVVSFESITPGHYTITASITISKNTYQQLSGTVVDQDVVFNGNLTNQSITEQQTNLNIPIVSGRIGNWVFKQIYYAGSNTSSGAAFRDQFLEIYNNSTDTLYADSLCFAQLVGVNNTTANYPTYGYLSNNQYDWTKAVGMNDANANTNYVYARAVFMIPGTGKQLPVLPGKSIVIAQTGQNHAAPYYMNDGTTQQITNPALTVNLSGADFEGYLVDYKRAESGNSPTFSPYKWDVDNPSVPNLNVVYQASGNDMLLDNLGREALIVYKTEGANPKSYPFFATPNNTTVTPTTTLYQQIPVKNIIDAVELQRVTESQRVPKRLPNAFDAGPTNVTAGEYSSHSLIRKTARTVNGRRILQDTNNSANDFATKAKADPTKTEASFSF